MQSYRVLQQLQGAGGGLHTMKNLIPLFMLLLAAVMAVPHAWAAEDNTAVVSVNAEVGVGDDDGTADQGSGDAMEDSTEDATDDHGEDAMEDESDSMDDDGTEDQGSGDAMEDESDSMDDDGTADQGTGDVSATDVSADVDTTVAVEAEAANMDTTLGAQVRLLQLEREIMRARLHMEAAISFVSANNTSTNVTALQSIVAEMKDLEQEAADAAQNPGDRDTALQTFLSIKADAKKLVAEFRETIKPMLGEGAGRVLNGKFEAIDRDQLKSLTDEIEQLKRDWLAQRVDAFLERAGITDAELIARVKSGDLTIDQVRSQLKDRFKELKQEDRQKTAERLSESRIKTRVEIRDRSLKIRSEVLSRVSDREEERAQKLEEKGFEDAAKRAQRLAQEMQKRSDTLDQRRDRLETKVRENIKDGRVETRTETRVRTDNSGSGSSNSGSGSEDQ